MFLRFFGKKVQRKKSPTEKRSNGKKVQRKKSPTEKKSKVIKSNGIQWKRLLFTFLFWTFFPLDFFSVGPFFRWTFFPLDFFSALNIIWKCLILLDLSKLSFVLTITGFSNFGPFFRWTFFPLDFFSVGLFFRWTFFPLDLFSVRLFFPLDFFSYLRMKYRPIFWTRHFQS